MVHLLVEQGTLNVEFCRLETGVSVSGQLRGERRYAPLPCCPPKFQLPCKGVVWPVVGHCVWTRELREAESLDTLDGTYFEPEKKLHRYVGTFTKRLPIRREGDFVSTPKCT
eukprot:scaffold28206_cov78-Cyclotella_meneghiniana.AAC.3